MNPSFIRSLAPVLAGAFLLGTAMLADAQVVTTGIVTAVESNTGLVTVRSDQTRRPMYFREMNRAKIMRSSGTPARLDDVWPGMRVTISYAQRAGRWYVGHLAIPDLPRPAAAPDVSWNLTPGERNAIYSKAANDNDITTRPGSRAFTDGDITIRPSRRTVFENDITRRSGNR